MLCGSRVGKATHYSVASSVRIASTSQALREAIRLVKIQEQMPSLSPTQHIHAGRKRACRLSLRRRCCPGRTGCQVLSMNSQREPPMLRTSGSRTLSFSRVLVPTTCGIDSSKIRRAHSTALVASQKILIRSQIEPQSGMEATLLLCLSTMI